MKKMLIYTAILVLILSCASFSKNNKVREKSFKIEDFEIYVFDICEKYKKNDTNYRFCECPDNFFEIAKKDSIKKVEETYFLVQKNTTNSTELVIYLTTRSHKYISEKQKGFLNDPEIYKNSILINQLDFIYVGEINRKKKHIFFNNAKNGEDIILHYDSENLSNKFSFKKVNIATVENGYDITNEIELDNVFSRKIEFKKLDYKIYFNDKKNNKVISFSFTSKSGKLRMFFEDQNSKVLPFKKAVRKILYQPNYYQIDVVE